MRLTIPVAALVFTTLLTACSGGGDDGDDGGNMMNPPPPAPPPAPTTALGGTAAKGIIQNGEVSIFEIGLDGTVATEALATATTDANGDYAAVLPGSYVGGPLKVEITAVAGTTMICDAPGGCGTVPFGGTIDLAPGFSMCAVIPGALADTVSVHVTPLTDMATKLAGATLEPGSIAEANDIVRQTFGLSGAITSARPVDVSDPTAMALADRNSQLVALYSAAILGAVLATDDVAAGAETLEDGLADFVQDYAAAGGLVLNDTAASEGAIVGKDDILAAAEMVLGQVASDAIGEDVDFDESGIDSVLALQTMALPPTQSDTPDTSIEPLDTAAASRIVRAATFVADLRLVFVSSALRDAADVFGDQIQNAFEEEVDLMTAVVSNDTGVVTEAMMYGMRAIVEAVEAWDDDAALTMFTVPAGDFDDDIGAIDVSISPASPSGTMFSVSQPIGGADVALDATLDGATTFTETNMPESEMSTIDVDVTLDVTGSSVNEEFSFTIEEGSTAAIDVNGMDTETISFPANENGGQDTVEDEDVSTTVDLLSLDLMAVLAQVNVPNPISFMGEVDISLTGGVTTFTRDLRESIDVETQQFAFSETETETYTFDTLNVSLTGAFADTLGNSVEGTMALDSDNVDDIVIVMTYMASFDGQSFMSEDSTTGETGESFIPVTVSAGLIGELPGIDPTTSLMLSATRSAEDEATFSGEMMFLGRVITISGDTETESLTLTNQDAVTIRVNEEPSTGNLVGTISVMEGSEEIVVATIEESDDDIVIVRFEDGSFESFQ